jgi:hypothetical protein
MSKTIEAFVQGYLFFDVNGKRFLLYHSAVSYRKTIDGNLLFKGWHIYKGWQGFFERFGVEE